MSSHMMRKTAHDGIRRAVVEMNGVDNVYTTVVPRVGGALREQARDALETVAAVMSEEGAGGRRSAPIGVRDRR